MGYPKKWKTDKFKREAPAPLKFGADGKFTILQISDPQDDAYPAHELDDFIRKSIETVKPDFIVLSEDSQGRFGDGYRHGLRLSGGQFGTEKPLCPYPPLRYDRGGAVGGNASRFFLPLGTHPGVL